jgi:hypothetical protein
MISTYTLGEYSAEDTVTDITYTNADGHVHVRTVNIPRDSDGEVIQDSFCQILADQLKNVNNKADLGLIGFGDPNVPDDAMLLEVPAEEPAEEG